MAATFTAGSPTRLRAGYLNGALVIAAIAALGLAPIGAAAYDTLHRQLIAKLADGDYSRRGADTCLRCHDGSSGFPVYAIFQTVHGHPVLDGSPFRQGGAAAPPAGLQCEACHGPIGAHGRQVMAQGEPREPMIAFGGRGNAALGVPNALCLECHRNYGRARWAGSAHEEAGLACASCHRIHAAEDPVRMASAQNAVCAACHRNVAADALKRSAHPIRESRLICRDCHDPHGGIGAALTLRPSINESCFACHAEKRGPFLWEHAPVAEDCSICHLPHGSNQPALLVRRPPQLCQGCHSSVGHRSLPQLAEFLPPSPASAFLVGKACLNCHAEVHGSNHPSGNWLRR